MILLWLLRWTECRTGCQLQLFMGIRTEPILFFVEMKIYKQRCMNPDLWSCPPLCSKYVSTLAAPLSYPSTCKVPVHNEQYVIPGALCQNAHISGVQTNGIKRKLFGVGEVTVSECVI